MACTKQTPRNPTLERPTTAMDSDVQPERGPVQTVIMALPNAHSWKAIREELKRCFSDQTSLGHAAAQLENMTQKPNEPLRLYIFRYSKIHKSVTKRDACYDTDPLRWFRFLTSITNTTIADKITRSEFLPQNLQQCFEKALRLEACLQLSEGVNMARRTTVMNVDVDTDDEVNLIKDVRARSNACYKCGEMGHFQRDCKYDGDKPTDSWQEQDGSFDSYDPVVGKWMTNWVATTPITAKAMKSIITELNRQKELKSLLPPVKKAFSKAKGILTLVPLPKIDEIYARLKGSNIYSTFDMRSGYYHMVLSEKSRPKSAFVSSFGKWEFKRCPFGLAQAPAYFQRLVNEVLSGLTFAFAYLDDILVYSPDMEIHLEHLRKLFIKLREADLKLKEVKCNFLKKHIQYLGHIVLGKGITPMPEKLVCIKEMPPAKTPKEVKQFLGLIRYYRKFVARFSDLANH